MRKVIIRHQTRTIGGDTGIEHLPNTNGGGELMNIERKKKMRKITRTENSMSVYHTLAYATDINESHRLRFP